MRCIFYFTSPFFPKTSEQHSQFSLEIFKLIQNLRFEAKPSKNQCPKLKTNYGVPLAQKKEGMKTAIPFKLLQWKWRNSISLTRFARKGRQSWETVQMVFTLTGILTIWLLKTQFTHLACAPLHKVNNTGTRNALLCQTNVHPDHWSVSSSDRGRCWRETGHCGHFLVHSPCPHIPLVRSFSTGVGG